MASMFFVCGGLLLLAYGLPSRSAAGVRGLSYAGGGVAAPDATPVVDGLCVPEVADSPPVALGPTTNTGMFFWVRSGPLDS